MKSGEAFYYVDEFNVSWLPALCAMWSPWGQQMMIPTPRQPYKRYGLAAVNDHLGETVYITWENSNTHENDEGETVVWAFSFAILAALFALIHSN